MSMAFARPSVRRHPTEVPDVCFDVPFASHPRTKLVHSVFCRSPRPPPSPGDPPTPASVISYERTAAPRRTTLSQASVSTAAAGVRHAACFFGDSLVAMLTCLCSAVLIRSGGRSLRDVVSAHSAVNAVV